MSPLHEERWSTVILMANQRVELPVNVTSEGPRTRRYDVLAHGWFMNQVTDGVGDIASNRDMADENLTNAGREEDNRGRRRGRRESRRGECICGDIGESGGFELINGFVVILVSFHKLE